MGDPLELPAAILGDVCADELPRVVEGRAGKKDLPAVAQRRNARGKVGCDSDDLGTSARVIDDLRHLADVNPDASAKRLRLPLLIVHNFLEPKGKSHRVADRGEGGEISVSRIVENLRRRDGRNQLLEKLVMPPQ